MPHFTLQIDANGPLLNVCITVSAARAIALTNLGNPIPEQNVVKGLVDTGASCTCIDPSVIKDLNIPPTGKTSLITPSTGTGEVVVDQYDVGLKIYAALEEVPYQIQNLAVVESELYAKQGFHVLIGRDVLSRCLLVYNGPTGNYTLGF